jgi:tetratricopeptide (TPR) repeat protein
MNFWEIISLLAIPSFILCILALFFAINQGKKAKNAENKINELMEAMTSCTYLKELAFSHYFNGKYDESLGVFKKYLLENKEENEWNEIITHILKKETSKIFSDIVVFPEGKMPKFSLLIQAFISHEDKYNHTHYPNIIKTLINDYVKIYNRNRALSELLIALFDNNWEKAKELSSKLEINKEEGINNSFKNYLFEYLNTKILNSKFPEKDNNFVDDIPF